ncbi:hypothetical protein [Leptospira sp. GIMC2001]|uniref:hypothetical protein n=1 Tax=Leptospira sp. GIMC2001 TaxID=1513297 RepID=UPI00234B64C5|nr:hypothetical protein [Leptospira sp. GIMC2001]WCL51510.1 hypothetical protein O4O04_20045 [Leptospira sp. GIMC2001]
MTAMLSRDIEQVQGDFEKRELYITSTLRQGISPKAGTKPFFVTETDTDRRYFWSGLNWILLTSDPGACDINVLRLASNVADEQTITIGLDVYELDRADDGVTEGRIPVKGHAGDTPAAVSVAIVDTVNSNVNSQVRAIKISDNEILFHTPQAGSKAIPCSETLAGANNEFASATTYGGRKAGTLQSPKFNRVPLAVEVALGNVHFVFDLVPVVVDIKSVTTATPGVTQAWDGAVAVSGNRVTAGNGGSTDWTTAQTLRLEVGVA